MGFAPRATRAGVAGDTLDWDKIDHDTWRIQPGAARSLSVSFSYLADTLDTAAAWAAPDFVMFNGTNVFLYPEGRPAEFAASVSIRTEADWKVATGMKPSAVASTPRSYVATNYHDLVDMPFMVGMFDLDSARIAERWTRLATYPVRSLTATQRAEVWRVLEKVIPPQQGRRSRSGNLHTGSCDRDAAAADSMPLFRGRNSVGSRACGTPWPDRPLNHGSLAHVHVAHLRHRSSRPPRGGSRRRRRRVGYACRRAGATSRSTGGAGGAHRSGIRTDRERAIHGDVR